MNIPKWSAEPLTVVQKRAYAAFKDTLRVKPPSDEEIAEKAFDENQMRWKAERLAREATNPARAKFTSPRLMSK